MIELSEASVLKLLLQNRELSEQVTRLHEANGKLLERARTAEQVVSGNRRLADRIEVRDLDPESWGPCGTQSLRCVECDWREEYAEDWSQYEDMALCPSCYVKIVRRLPKTVDLEKFIEDNVTVSPDSEKWNIEIAGVPGDSCSVEEHALDVARVWRISIRKLLKKFVAEQEGT